MVHPNVGLDDNACTCAKKNVTYQGWCILFRKIFTNITSHNYNKYVMQAHDVR